MDAKDMEIASLKSMVAHYQGELRWLRTDYGFAIHQLEALSSEAARQAKIHRERLRGLATDVAMDLVETVVLSKSVLQQDREAHQ